MHRYLNFFITLNVIFFVQTGCCSEQKTPLTLTESCCIGACVAGAEVVFPGQILTYGMNQRIKKAPFEFRSCYKGFVANAVGEMPVGAIQKIVQTKGSQAIESWQDHKLSCGQNAAVSYGSGVVGALVATPSNAVQLYMQEKSNAGTTVMQSCRALGCKSMRGFVPNALIKEGPFAVAYQVAAQQTEIVAKQYVDHDYAAKILGGVSAGVLTAVITQPGAVLRNKMQGDLFAKKSNQAYPTMRQTVQKIYKQEGAAGFFTGLKQRGARVAVAVPLYAAYSAYLQDMIKK